MEYGGLAAPHSAAAASTSPGGSGGNGGISAYSATGSAFSVAAGRVAFLFALRGPAAAVDTACSSALVAVHLGARHARDSAAAAASSGSSSPSSPLGALAGGVNLALSQANVLDLLGNFVG